MAGIKERQKRYTCTCAITVGIMRNELRFPMLVLDVCKNDTGTPGMLPDSRKMEDIIFDHHVINPSLRQSLASSITQLLSFPKRPS